ncbi:MAG: hypothetical protein E7664_04985 [Ruminococcaceae bacterium]|nr:hypothetical protein [Oscillospiraceae bacterium]
MFFTPRLQLLDKQKPLFVSSETKLRFPACLSADYVNATVQDKLVCERPTEHATECCTITLSLGLPLSVRTQLTAHTELADNKESYAIVLGSDTVIYAEEPSGLLFGLITLVHLKDAEELCEGMLYDYPSCPIRGYRVYLPGRKNIPEFKRMVDMLAYYKYNAIMPEIGGAMEYRRHPEINEKWVEYCQDMRSHSGRTFEVQKGYTWPKNSIHCDNGNGEFLTQDECRELAAYCRERGIEVYPECPTLSHCDYLVMAHPEIRERAEDPYPDTYCPQHPDTYRLVFDILDEVIDVFRPRYLNIGHDELCSACVCEKCRGKDPVDFYVEDIEVINEYLKGKGIKTLMWGEKLLRAVGKDGTHYGGWSTPKNRNGVMSASPTLYPCADRMPKDVTFMHWYYAFDPELDMVYHDHGYSVIFGNFQALSCKHYRKRTARGIRGGFVSNWGANDEENMQRNHQNISLISTAYAFWGDDYDYDLREQYIEKAMKEDYRRKHQGISSLITVTHTTPYYIPYQHFYDGRFIEDEVYLLGHYTVSYEDGTKALLPVKYGTNITCATLGEMPYDNQSYKEVSGSTLPLCENGKLFYRCGYENPHPGKRITGMAYEPLPHMRHVPVIIKSIELPFTTEAKQVELAAEAHIFQD